MKKATWILFAFLAVVIGLYPIIYLFIDQTVGLLASKSAELFSNSLWNIGFYGHISFGGLALLVGWSQFSPKWRANYIKTHRTIGKIYVGAVLISGFCGLYIAFFATGGMISILGFLSLAVIWLTSTILALRAILKKKIELHKKLMIYSYAACFAAVTLRIWLPLLQIALGDFISAYHIVAWLCWVPNIIFAFYLGNRRKRLATSKI